MEEIKSEKDILLANATKQQLINELSTRNDTNTILINKENGAQIKFISGNINVTGKSYIITTQIN